MTEPADLTATRAGYDALAEQYGDLSRASLDAAPLDRALLGAFAESVLADHPDPVVLDAGCGPGTIAGHLARRLGVPARGVDLSPAMVEHARRAHPGIVFDVGEMGALALADSSVAGLVAWYSLIHVPAGRRQDVLREFGRVLRPGGHVLLAFQVGEDTLYLDEAFGRPVRLDFHRLLPDDVAALLEGAGFDVTARLVRAPDPGSVAARIPQGFLMARKAA
ncbi:Methyltransferase domain-containing protein [Blastococcus aurantiacus]|uniref:Methyltransferase domain-containing protein n=1 Tax=Blastococcus aurantiacus TaxID=1550231 RepID=A0A1G7P428_9ACTN|nr:class I SAM-dependent methyltransferase [Blastococcus aurantiacus]SDF81013.1 Methyltransferase domain-containing protein [Blastococcus aurantiacus]